MTATMHSPAGHLTSPQETASRLQSIKVELSLMFYERHEAVEALMTAMLAGQHALLLGPPGTAKSALARELTSRITGARYWETLLSPFTDPKRIFGPIDVAALTQGEYRQMLEGRATHAHVAFIDEIFKCGEASLNEMLAFLNERLYHPEAGGDPIRCPLIAAIAASNELGDEETAALYDRFLVRLQVQYLKEPTNFAAMIRRTPGRPRTASPTRTTVDLANLIAAVEQHVPAISVGDGLIETISTLRSTLRNDEGLVVSDRRWDAAVSLMQASAFLAGRSAVEDPDLMVLQHVLWNTPEQRATVERLVLQTVDPNAGKVLDHRDAVHQLNAQLDGMKGKSQQAQTDWALKEGNPKIGRTIHELKEMRAKAEGAGRSTATIDEALAECDALRNRILKDVLGVVL
ncbi:AAA family ATPase [Actinomadura sp. NPDC048955]|uniref:AAA family ATPase n=1 Tax=Actinomadura sp. NPDC048955 TaxID=3158228 RepID=UPI0033E81038